MRGFVRATSAVFPVDFVYLFPVFLLTPKNETRIHNRQAVSAPRRAVVSVRAAAVNTSSYAKVEEVRKAKEKRGERRERLRLRGKEKRKERPLAKHPEMRRQREDADPLFPSTSFFSPPLAPPPKKTNKQTKTLSQGKRSTTDFRIFAEEKGKPISWWHDVPLKNDDGTLNFICEIPKESSAKMEVATTEARNPIKQDIKKGNLRFYPYNINWNYGLLPQTWEDPAHEHPELKVKVGGGKGGTGGEREERRERERGTEATFSPLKRANNTHTFIFETPPFGGG